MNGINPTDVSTTPQTATPSSSISIRSSGSSVASAVNTTASNNHPVASDTVALAAPERVVKAIDALVKEVLDTLLSQPVDFKNPPFKLMDRETVNRLVEDSSIN